MNVTVCTQSFPDTYKRMSLPTPTWTGRDEIGTGVIRTAIYISPRAKRVVVAHDSIWESKNGRCQGTTYSLVESDSDLAHLAAAYPEVAEVLEKHGLLIPEEL